jgi:hypothetical protein
MTSSFPALDVALGVAFVFFLLSVLVTALTEAVAWLSKQRSKQLESWLSEALANPNGPDLVAEFKNSAAFKALQLSSGGKPSYIPSAHFLNGVRQASKTIRATVGPAVGEAETAWTALGSELESISATPVGGALQGVYERADGDLIRYRHEAESWFDDQMERLSGAYRRWAAWVNGALALGLVAALNANAIRIAQLLWSDPTIRSSVVAGAGSSGSGQIPPHKAITMLQTLPLPLGWSGGWSQSGYHDAKSIIYALLGALLTMAAISLGAPFWFDTLSKLARIRTTGAPPPATGAERRGEGDQSRVGPTM